MKKDKNLLDNLDYREFKRLLFFAKTKQDENFRVFLHKGIYIFNNSKVSSVPGIEIFDEINKEKIAEIHLFGKSNTNVVVFLYTVFNSSKRFSDAQKLKKARDIYNRLKEGFNEINC